ncbi:MAG: hypothetical protein LBE13_16145 [Bacteroidales bacterium]|jgi:hypothetical protein|nr:hypothetical protein [Bacteroidales bacterium]
MDKKISVSDEINPSSSVPASAFGWDFQVNAAIVLMLKNIKEAKAVKVEGPTDDIEIYLKNGNVIFSQAKSVFDRDNYKPVIKNLERSLDRLYNDSLQSNAGQLIYITNSPNPFNNQKTMYAFTSGFNPYHYSSLPRVCKNKIDEILEKRKLSIDINKLSVYVLQFSQDLNNRYKVIKEITNELINSFNLGITDIGNDVLEIWQNDFFHNASAPKPDITITKSEMLWPLAVILCEFNRDDNIFRNLDSAIIEEIEHKYKKIVNTKTEQFSFFIKVISSFDEHDINNADTKDRIKSFISKFWIDYADDFHFLESEINIKEHIIKFTLSNILRKRFYIGKIKEKTGL